MNWPRQEFAVQSLLVGIWQANADRTANFQVGGPPVKEPPSPLLPESTDSDACSSGAAGARRQSLRRLAPLPGECDSRTALVTRGNSQRSEKSRRSFPFDLCTIRRERKTLQTRSKRARLVGTGAMGGGGVRDLTSVPVEPGMARPHWPEGGSSTRPGGGSAWPAAGR